MGGKPGKIFSDGLYRSPVEHTGKPHPRALPETFGAAGVEPECQSVVFPVPFVDCQDRADRIAAHTLTRTSSLDVPAFSVSETDKERNVKLGHLVS